MIMMTKPNLKRVNMYADFGVLRDQIQKEISKVGEVLT